MTMHDDHERATGPSTTALEKRPYHAPELTAHGELAVLTKGIGGSGADAGFYTSIPG